LYYFYPVTVIDDMGGMPGTGDNVEVDLYRHTILPYAQRIQQAGNSAVIPDLLLFSIKLNVHGSPRKQKSRGSGR
jgi:hypothetical protein